jgi:uncharacterized protein
MTTQTHSHPRTASNMAPDMLIHLSTLEARFPRVASAIQLLWGYPEMDTYFAKLVVDDRGDREGFPPDVMSDIMLLASMHQSLYPPKQMLVRNKSCAYDLGLNFS